MGSGRGFKEEFWAERDFKEQEIASQRKVRDTYKHERQVRAEAEALLIVQNIRKGLLRLNGKKLNNSYFVSNTRVIDEVAGGGLRITLRPASVLQWIAALTRCDVEELHVLTNSLVWELSEGGFEIVDKVLIQTTFKPLISAAKEKLAEELDQHRALISGRYGEDNANAFGDTSDLDAPVVLESLYAQKADELGQKLQEERTLRQEVQERARMTEGDRNELARLRVEETRRKAQARKNARKNANRGQKKKRKRRRAT